MWLATVGRAPVCAMALERDLRRVVCEETKAVLMLMVFCFVAGVVLPAVLQFDEHN